MERQRVICHLIVVHTLRSRHRPRNCRRPRNWHWPRNWRSAAVLNWRRSAVVTAIMITGIGVIAGCSSTITGSPVAATSAASPGKAAKIKAACPLLSSSDLGAALGKSGLSAKEDDPAYISAVTEYVCDYSLPSGHIEALLYVAIGKNSDEPTVTFMKNLQVSGGTATRFSGLGDVAEYSTGRNDKGKVIDEVVTVKFESDTMIGIAIMCLDQPGARASLTGVATQVLPKT